jgi:hypothetical protein
MSEGVFGFFFGILFGVTLTGLIQAVNPSASVNIVSKAMAECEKSLPRDQKCVIIAVPPSID